MYQARSILQFESVAENRTKLTFTSTGYGKGPEWGQLYNFGIRANRYTLVELHKRIENGPVDWEAKDAPEITSP